MSRGLLVKEVLVGPEQIMSSVVGVIPLKSGKSIVPVKIQYP